MVTANKQLLARHGPELLQAAEEAGAELRFEASACAAIPVIKVLRESLLAAEITAVTGIVNGTTNFILTEMARGGLPYAEALARAQGLGYAEADPTEDVNGADAAAKMAILSSIAFHSRVRIDDVPYEGIDRLHAEDIEHARSLGFVVKLLGVARLLERLGERARVPGAGAQRPPPGGHPAGPTTRCCWSRGPPARSCWSARARAATRRRPRWWPTSSRSLGTHQGSFLHNALADSGRTIAPPGSVVVGLLPAHVRRRPPRRARPRRVDLRRRGAVDPLGGAERVARTRPAWC